VENQVGLVVVSTLKSLSKALPRKIAAKVMPMIQKNQVFSVEFLVRIKVKYQEEGNLMQKLKVAIIGGGQFSASFIHLFQAHPMVQEVGLVEPNHERRASTASKFQIKQSFNSLEQLWGSDFNAVAIFTPRWTHAQIALEALKNGRHVYTAVPMGITQEEVSQLVDVASKTKLTYFMAETSYYYPAVIFSRRKFASGELGSFVYGEGEYLHDMSHGFTDAYAANGGDEWKSTASFPPMLYSTHSVSTILSVTGAHATSVTCVGLQDSVGDGIFDSKVSKWGNDHSNQIALFRTSDGGVMRIAELRRVGTAPLESTVRMSIFGTEGSFEQQVGYASWATKNSFDIITDEIGTFSDVENPYSLRSDYISPNKWDGGFAKVHDRSQLPKEFLGLSNGHGGSHQFMVDDFVMGAMGERRPPMDVRDAARFTIPGILAHQSAGMSGKWLDIPHF
jgi:predicted dehydrogenase